MKYSYVVYRYFTKEKDDTTKLPLLGVHKTRKAAESHLKSVLSHRQSLGAKLTILTKEYDLNSKRKEIAKYLVEIETDREVVLLERWTI